MTGLQSLPSLDPFLNDCDRYVAAERCHDAVAFALLLLERGHGAIQSGRSGYASSGTPHRHERDRRQAIGSPPATTGGGSARHVEESDEIAVISGGKSSFDRLRRASKLSFDELYRLFADNISLYEIARRAGVSRTRVATIYRDHFSDIFQTSAIARLRERERSRRQKTAAHVNALISNDSVLNAIRELAARAKSNRTIRPIMLKRSDVPIKLYRHRAVMVGSNIEPVHHLRNARSSRGRGLKYATTTLYQNVLEQTTWSLFVIDVPGFPQRVIRSRNRRLLQSLFGGQDRMSVYIPLDGRPENPRYDFLADEDNWD